MILTVIDFMMAKGESSMYETMATQKTPALIIYLLDISASMYERLGRKRRINVVTEALMSAFRQMIFRSTKGGRLAARYRVALLAYSDQVYDIFGGIKTIDEIAQLGIPKLGPQRSTGTAKAFAAAEQILAKELPNLDGCPAPLVCHMTDGEFNWEDPEPYARRIMEMKNSDGNVLIENIFITDSGFTGPFDDVSLWSGILPDSKLTSPYAEKLRKMSSPIPDSYRETMQESNYNFAPGALMLFPGVSPELVALGFQMSAATPVR